MEGYSVTEAASVLGVPTERVWELLARGILAGQPEGEAGMRVFLQSRPAPAAAEPASGRTNGGEPEPRGEPSPFRELLTEFRNLTERYGQALLALGEARGEVAALRSRVDLLEARMDLRLPSGAAASPPIGWTQPVPWPAPGSAAPPAQREHAEPGTAAPAPEPAEPEAPRPVAAATEGAAEDEAEVRRARRGGTGRATESFAEALARAEDPSMPELLGGSESAAPHAAWRHAAATDEAGAPEVSLPRELPPADAVPVADEGSSEEPQQAVEATEHEAAPEIEAAEASELDAGVEPPSAEMQSEQPAAASAEEAPPATAEAEPMPVEAPSGPSEEDAVPAWQSERYTAEIAEPDWWEAEALPEQPAATSPPSHTPDAGPVEGQPEPETAVADDEPGAVEGEPEEAEETEPSPTIPRPAPSGHATIGRLRPTATWRDEETVLWLGRQPAPEADAPSGDAPSGNAPSGGADEMEIAPGGLAAAEPAEEAAEEPVAEQSGDPRRLDDALAALEALSQATPRDAGRSSAPPAGDERRNAGAEPPPSRSPAASRGQSSTGGRAYRRLRRIFPG